MASKVFSTVEVFEAILNQLDLRKLLVVQQVSREWHSVIKTSPRLQQSLFLQPSYSHNATNPEMNPILRELFPVLFTDTNYSGSKNQEDFAPFNGSTDFQDQYWFKDKTRRKAILREEASWRCMFPLQPPTRIGRIERFGGCCNMSIWAEYEGVIRPEFEGLQEHGARMGLVYDIVILLLESNPSQLRGDEGTVDVPFVNENEEEWECGSGFHGVMVAWDTAHGISIHHVYDQDCMERRDEGRKLVSGLRVKELDSRLIKYDDER